MKKYILLVVSFLMISSFSYGAERVLSEKEVAKKYFEALIGGDSEAANNLSTIPFSFDGKIMIQEKEKLEEKHIEIAENKGKRPIPKYKITIAKKAEKLDESIFPEYLVYCITIEGGDESIYIYVTKGQNPKAIGFLD